MQEDASAGKRQVSHGSGRTRLACRPDHHRPTPATSNALLPARRASAARLAVTLGPAAIITLNYTADDAYLDTSGAGTPAVTVGHKASTYEVGCAPDIYTVVSGRTLSLGHLGAKWSPGLSAFSFTFG